MIPTEVEQMVANPGPLALHSVLQRAREAGIEHALLTVTLMGEGLIVTLLVAASGPDIIDSKLVDPGASWEPVITSMYRAIRERELAAK